MLYFHGLPGSAAELTSFGPATGARAGCFHVVERGELSAESPVEAHFARLADRIAERYPDEQLVLVGFSLGAAAALRVATHLAARVQRIDLVAPAGPLALGDFLGGMAGASVFRAALAGRAHLATLTWAQAQVARFAAEQMAAKLMAKARGEDRALAADPQFIAGFAQSLRTSLLDRRAAYAAEILAYVCDWSGELAKVHQPVAIWQGSEDDWTPPAMARAMAKALPNCSGITLLPGHSHFSTLRHYLDNVAIDRAS